MGRLRARWLGVVFLIIVLAGGVAWLSTFLSSRGMDWAARFSEIASFVLAGLGLVPLLAGKIAQWVPTPKIKDGDCLTGTFDEVLEFFRQLPEPRLVVLGEAGAGKPSWPPSSRVACWPPGTPMIPFPSSFR